MENVTKLSIQNFDFQNFVKEIFSFWVCHFSKKLKILLMANFKSKILCDKILKIKILIESIIALSDGYVMVYLIFSGGALFMENFIIQNCLFWDFSKTSKLYRFCGANNAPYNAYQSFFFSILLYFPLDSYTPIFVQLGLAKA